MNPGYEPSGHQGYRFNAKLNNHLSLEMFYGMAEHAENSTKFVKLVNNYKDFSISILAGERLWTFTDYNIMEDWHEKRQFAGTDIKTQISGFTIWVEGMYNWMEISDEYEEFVFGTEKSLGHRGKIILEYYRYGLGNKDYRKNDINDWFNYFYGQKKAMCQDQLLYKVSYELNKYCTLSNSIMHSLNDGSLKVFPCFSFQVNNNLYFELMGGYNSGNKPKVFHSYGGRGFHLASKFKF
jgi:hypothetical protein